MFADQLAAVTMHTGYSEVSNVMYLSLLLFSYPSQMGLTAAELTVRMCVWEWENEMKKKKESLVIKVKFKKSSTRLNGWADVTPLFSVAGIAAEITKAAGLKKKEQIGVRRTSRWRLVVRQEWGAPIRKGLLVAYAQKAVRGTFAGISLGWRNNYMS